MARARKGDTGADTAVPVETPEPDENAVEAPGESNPTSDPDPDPEPGPDFAPDAPQADEPTPDAHPVLEPEPATDSRDPVVEARPARRRGGFVGVVLGGAIAAGLGFGAATYVMPRFAKPEVAAEDILALKAGLADQSARLGAATKTIEEIRSDTSAQDLSAAQSALTDRVEQTLAELKGTLDALDARLSDAGARLDGLDGRLADLEKRPVEGGAASATALEAFGREMAAVRAEMEAQRLALAAAQEKVEASAITATDSIAAAAAEAEALHAEAEVSARRTAARAALSHIEASLSSGGAFGPAVAELAAAGVDVPAALSDQAQGVPTMDALRDAFAPAARAALAVSLKQTAGGTTWERITAFLRVQSGARSLAPKAGTDPDAILSRAEAALNSGDLTLAIGEIGGLPGDGQARMSEWVNLAGRRIAATEAAHALAAALK